MTLLRGPKILNSGSTLPVANAVLGDLKGQNTWLFGCLFLFSSTLCWSFWLTLQVNFTPLRKPNIITFFVRCLALQVNFVSTKPQVPISAYYPDHLSLSAWMCLFGTLQCAVVTFFLEKDPNSWILHSYSEFATCLYAVRA